MFGEGRGACRARDEGVVELPTELLPRPLVDVVGLQPPGERVPDLGVEGDPEGLGHSTGEPDHGLSLEDRPDTVDLVLATEPDHLATQSGRHVEVLPLLEEERYEPTEDPRQEALKPYCPFPRLLVVLDRHPGQFLGDLRLHRRVLDGEAGERPLRQEAAELIQHKACGVVPARRNIRQQQ